MTQLQQEETREVKFPISLQIFYERMITSSSSNGYALESGVAKCLRKYMFKENFDQFLLNKKLKNLKPREIILESDFEDFSNKRKFIKMWIEECVRNHNLEGEFSINDFEQKMREGLILVKK
ncbi:hypothetical protein [Mycoplasma procyoni]|uniref:hypothetical protein n=1 Tax=Mycoplasma procyoni TaxID=568784 RepID=UPI00197B8CD1|nr:hypothetical protein [Mycoplasma procyoni]MBN3534733.1 hypothetical protein [Mycoplasma procyoni]